MMDPAIARVAIIGLFVARGCPDRKLVDAIGYLSDKPIPDDPMDIIHEVDEAILAVAK